MNTKNPKNWTKFPVLFSLYIAQSVPMSFFSTVVPVIMRQEKYSLESIGLLQLVKLPWILKFLWAPLVDNNAKNLKSVRRWIIFSELFYAVVIISIGFLNLKTDFTLIIFLIIIAFIASAFQDIGTDIFAIHILKKEERAFGNSMQSGGSFAGSLLGTGVLLLVYYYFGWTNLLYLLALFVGFAIIPLMVYRPEVRIESNKHDRVKITDIFSFFKKRANLKRLPLLAFYYSGIIGILSMLKPYMVDLGYDIKQIGFMSGIIGTSVAAISTLLAGFIIKFTGRKMAFYLFSCINILAAAYFVYLTGHVPGIAEIYAGICVLWGAYGLSTVIIYTSSMDAVRKSREGTDFTVQIVITHLSSLIVAVLSGRIGDQFGYNGLFIIEMILGCIALLIVIFNYPLRQRQNDN